MSLNNSLITKLRESSLIVNEQSCLRVHEINILYHGIDILCKNTHRPQKVFESGASQTHLSLSLLATKYSPSACREVASL